MHGWNRWGVPRGARRAVEDEEDTVGRGPRGWIVVAVALALAPASARAAGPHRPVVGNAAPVTDVVGDTASVDLGVVPVGEETRHTFRIANDAATPLTVRPQHVPPGVTLPTLDGTIVPGGHGRVEVALDGFAFAGPTSLEVVLATDDTARTIRLALTADVHAFVIADPGYARYLFVQGASPGTIGQTVFATDGAPFRVTHVASPLAALQVRVREARPDERAEETSAGTQWRIESTLASQPPVGPLGGFLDLTLDHPRQHRLRIPVSGFVRPMFAVTPPAGDLGEVHAGEPVRGRFVVKNFAAEGITLERVRSDVPGLTADVRTEDSGHTFSIGLTVAADTRPGRFDGRLRIATSTAKQRQIEIPIHGVVLAPASAAASAAISTR